MKIILSRKGFDGSNGGIPSPIMPDGTLLSMPIPSNDNVTYQQLIYQNVKYDKILNDLGYKKNIGTCHVDPDIRENVRINKINDWKPAFGQIDAAQGYLHNSGVEKGDVFLFFGCFRKIHMANGRYSYEPNDSNDFYKGNQMQIIFGYMQVGNIINDINDIQKYYWHPHSSKQRLKVQNNTLYIPSNELSILPRKSGYGVLNFHKKRVLTKKGYSPGIWNENLFLMPNNIIGCKRKNSAKNGGLYYQGIWQELVINGNQEALNWLKEILTD